jgi:hypothetical protein
MLAALASEDDVADLSRLYQDLFELPDDSVPIELPDPEALKFGDAVAPDADLGVEMETKLNPSQLSTLLGFVDAIPFQLNRYRHKGGLLRWDKPEAFANEDSPDLVRVQLHWHQLCAIHAIVRNVFTAKPIEESVPGILIADEVGLGKTAVAITTIAFLSYSRWLGEAKKAPLPPILGQFPSVSSLVALTVCLLPPQASYHTSARTIPSPVFRT